MLDNKEPCIFFIEIKILISKSDLLFGAKAQRFGKDLTPEL